MASGGVLRWVENRLRSGEGIAPIGLGSTRAPAALVSGRALEDHFALYLGYCEALNRAAAGGPPETHGCRRAPSFLVGAVALHEVYFHGITDRPVEPDGALVTAIVDRWGSLDAWWRNTAAAATCTRGWAVLGAARNGALELIVLDSHDPGPSPAWEPVCAVDVYEHAYWRNFGPDRSVYLERLYEYLDWPEMQRRYVEAMLP